VFVVLKRRELELMRLLLRHRLHLGALLGFEPRLLDLGMPDRVQASSLFLLALLVAVPAVFFGLQARLLLLASAPLGFEPRLHIRFGPSFLLVVFLADAILLEVHQLLEGEEDRAFLLFSHGIGAPSKSLTFSLATPPRAVRAQTSVACQRLGAKPLVHAGGHKR
jgi:hypothetical protein